MGKAKQEDGGGVVGCGCQSAKGFPRGVKIKQGSVKEGFGNLIVLSDGDISDGHGKQGELNDDKSDGEVELPEPPKEVMVFPTIEDVVRFYNKYAYSVGFRIKSHSSYKRDDGVTWKYVYTYVRQGESTRNHRDGTKGAEDDGFFGFRETKGAQRRLGITLSIYLKMDLNIKCKHQPQVEERRQVAYCIFKIFLIALHESDGKEQETLINCEVQLTKDLEFSCGGLNSQLVVEGIWSICEAPKWSRALESQDRAFMGKKKVEVPLRELTPEEALVLTRVEEIPHPPHPPTQWIEDILPAILLEEEESIDLWPRDITLYHKVGSGNEPVQEPYWDML
ncbi:hypothetical protein Scep_014299 [Stephania cephalantha]|uniref:FAR1 domain-containing protein n=1 Tax=Stephania cephalantha TaxID=152367 RepID=A0AAP0P082_9MAGN